MQTNPNINKNVLERNLRVQILHKSLYVIIDMLYVIGIKHGFSCINIRQVPWEVLITEVEGRGFQQVPRDLANVNALKNRV